MDGRGPSPLRPPVTPYKQEALSPMDSAVHPSIQAGRVAVITGAASGIGRAAAVELAKYVLYCCYYSACFDSMHRQAGPSRRTRGCERGPA